MKTGNTFTNVMSALRHSLSLVKASARLLAMATVVLLFSGVARRVDAAPGDLDPSFGAGGKVSSNFFNDTDEARDVAIQADGKIVVAGVVCFLTVTSNEPENGSDDGDTAPDWEVLDAHHVRLRAERAGGGAGRVYTIAITCFGSNGGTSTRSVMVSVPLSNP